MWTKIATWYRKSWQDKTWHNKVHKNINIRFHYTVWEFKSQNMCSGPSASYLGWDYKIIFWYMCLKHSHYLQFLLHGEGHSTWHCHYMQKTALRFHCYVKARGYSMSLSVRHCEHVFQKTLQFNLLSAHWELCTSLLVWKLSYPTEAETRWPTFSRRRYSCKIVTSFFNTLRSRQDGWRFPDGVFKWIFLNENVWIFNKISLKFVPKGRINKIPALVQIMAWCLSGDKPLSESMMA